MNNKLTFSNILIVISFIATVLVYLKPDLYIFGINNAFLDKGIYHIYVIQFFTGSFLHGGFFHLLANSIFLFFFGNIVEMILGRNKFIIFFVFATLFNGIMLSIYSVGTTVGISGFCMALITYYTLELRSKNNPEYKGGITAILLNIGIGLIPGISLLGHLFGVIGGILFYLFNKQYLKRKMVGLITEKS